MTNSAEELSAWDRVSASYAEKCTPLTRLHATDAVAALHSQLSSSPCTVLDIACGAGAFALSYFQRYPRGVRGHRLILTDNSQCMVAEAERSLTACRLTDTDTVVEFRKADATNLSAFTDASIDAVASVFGVFLVPNRPRVFSEIQRVLKPGGAFVTTAWTATPTPLPSGFGYDFEQMWGGVMAAASPPAEDTDDKEKKEESSDWDAWRDNDKAHAMMRDSNFENVAIWKTMHSVPLNGPKQVWDVILSFPVLDLSSYSDEEVQQKYLKFKEQMFPNHDDSKHSMILLTSASNIVYATT